MSVYYYKARNCWRVSWYENDKKIVRYFKTEQEAQSFESERLQRKEPEKERLTLGELMYLFYRNNPDKNYETKKKVVYFLCGYDKDGQHVEGVGEFLRDKYAESLSRKDLEAMREALRNRGTSNNTINKYQAYIRAILAWGVDQELISLNPWRDFKRLKTKKYEFKATFDQFRKILEVAPDWLSWALLTAYALSLRPGQKELFSLPWTAFKWRYGYVLVPHQGKTNRPKKVIPNSKYWNQAQKRYAQDKLKNIIWVCHRNGNQIKDYRYGWHKALKDAGLSGSGIRFYDIRHISATEMLARGADLAAVSAQLGHSNTHTTAVTYVHVLPEAQVRAANLLPDFEPEE